MIVIDRNDINHMSSRSNEAASIVARKISKCDLLINCIGMLPAGFSFNGTQARASILANTVIPHLLSAVCKETGVKFVHFSSADVLTEMKDVYTCQKAAAEKALNVDDFILRPSLVLEGLYSGRVLSQLPSLQIVNKKYYFSVKPGPLLRPLMLDDLGDFVEGLVRGISAKQEVVIPSVLTSECKIYLNDLVVGASIVSEESIGVVSMPWGRIGRFFMGCISKGFQLLRLHPIRSIEMLRIKTKIYASKD